MSLENDQKKANVVVKEVVKENSGEGGIGFDGLTAAVEALLGISRVVAHALVNRVVNLGAIRENGYRLTDDRKVVNK